jgi:hypothetical protein
MEAQEMQACDHHPIAQWVGGQSGNPREPPALGRAGDRPHVFAGFASETSMPMPDSWIVHEPNRLAAAKLRNWAGV